MEISKNLDNNRDFHAFAKLSDVNLNLTFRISSLLGHLPIKSRTELLDSPEEKYFGAQQSAYPDLYVTVRLYSDNKPLSLPFQTSYKPFKNNHQWSEWITMPYKLCDLPLNSQLAFTVHDVKPSCYRNKGKGKQAESSTLEGMNDAAFDEESETSIIGGTCFKLFGKKGTLKKAQHRLLLWPGVEGDGSAESSTPAKVALGATEDGNSNSIPQDEMGRLEKLIKRHERSDLPRLSWLDKLVYRRIEKINSEETSKSDRIYLYIDMPRFDLPIVFCEQEASPPVLESIHGGGGSNIPTTNSATSTNKDGNGPSNTNAGALNQDRSNTIDSSLFTIVDPEIARDNPVESKHRRLVRSHRSGPLDRELKPNAAVRDELNEILSYPPTRVLSPTETDRIWSFRFYLTRDPKGLTKFLKSVVWSDSGEAKQATEVLLPMWTEPGLDDALELLGPTFKDPRVRAFAVKLLERAEDEELILYLLQLVQALKFDSFSPAISSTNNSAERGNDRKGNGLNNFSPTSSFINSNTAASSPSNSSNLNNSNGESGLTDFLIRRSLKNPVLGNNLYWYLVVECEDKTYGKMYRKVKARFWEKMGEAPNGAAQRELFTRQATLLQTLSTRAKELRSSKDARPKKIDKLRALISDSKSGLEPGKLDPPLPLPLDARVKVSGIRADKSTIFKSNLFPLLLHFEKAEEEDQERDSQDEIKKTKNKRAEETLDSPSDSIGPSTSSNSTDWDSSEVISKPSYCVIFKNGDDLRQDQLVIQLFTLMDRLLRNENLDLKITPYKVLATGSIDGMVQFVPSLTIAAIMNSFGGSLLNYLRHHHPDEGSTQTYGVNPTVLDTFVRSCAGYCVVTYLLGVGDRHLDNLLLSPDGHFFHVDFGYILGRDPKPFAPPVKVCKEMIDGMGGSNSIHHKRFRSLCFTAYTSLRKSANLILNLVALMVDANVPDIKVEPDKAVLKVQDKFRLDLSEDDAIKHFEALLNETNSYTSAFFDRLHGFAQSFRQ